MRQKGRRGGEVSKRGAPAEVGPCASKEGILFLRSDRTIEIPFRINHGNAILVEAEVNGVKGDWLFDTGFNAIVTPANISRSPLVSDKAAFSMFGNSYETELRQCPEIRVNGRTIKNEVGAFALPEELYGFFDYEGIIGLLPLGVFDGHYLEIRFSDSKILLHTNPPKAEEYNKVAPASYTDGFNIVTDILVNGASVHMTIDTGCYAAFRLPESALTGLLPGSAYRVVERIPVTGAVYREYALAKVDVIEAFDAAISDVILDTNIYGYSAGVTGGYGYLGMEFLKNFDLILDLTRKGGESLIRYRRNADANNKKEACCTPPESCPVP